MKGLRGQKAAAEGPSVSKAAGPDPSLLLESDLDVYLECGVLPWRRRQGRVVYVACDPDAMRKAAPRLSVSPSPTGFPVERHDLPYDELCEYVLARFGDVLRARAVAGSARLTPDQSAVAGAAPWQKRLVHVLAIWGAALLMFSPGLLVALMGCLLGLLCAGCLALRAVALAALALWRAPPAPPFLSDADSPSIAILVPLYREAAVLPKLVASLEALDYPRDKLRVTIILEQDDAETQAAFAALCAPPWMGVCVTPPVGPRTKPKAMNWALQFARADIIGIYDAEDRPDPDQLRKAAAALAAGGPRLACVQARLCYDNPHENGISGVFALEYAFWFDWLLPGFARMGWPIPLGGTSCFMRSDVLRAVGGWDSHNVTEDADLGVRLARAGWRVADIPSTTWEEATCVLWPWVRQRTRWIKGFAVTWRAQTRDMPGLLRDLGWARLGVVNGALMGAALCYLAAPLHLAAFIWSIVMDAPPWAGVLPEWLCTILTGLFWVGQFFIISCLAFAGWRRRRDGLSGWAAILSPLYFLMGAVAGARAFWQMAHDPFAWDKTSHGVSLLRKARAEPLSAAA